jgi:UDP-glucose 4-epimerase
MKILILGGAGFIGSNLVRYCLSKDSAEITVMDSLDPHLHASIRNLRAVWQKIRFVRGDMRDETLLAEIIQGQDVIFNCAAQTSHPLSIQYPLLDAEINCLGNLKLLEAVRLLNPKAVVLYPSSSTVIGKAEEPTVDEDHGEKPLEIYSANKGVAEKYYRIYHTLHDLNTIVLRFANLYGPYGKAFPEFGFINYFIHLAMEDKTIEIFGEGRQHRNVMYVEDAVEILWKAAFDPQLRGRMFFATGNQHLPVREIAEAVVRMVGKGRVRYIEWPDERRRIEVDHVAFSAARLQALTGWQPRHSFEEGLKKTVEIMKASAKDRP